MVPILPIMWATSRRSSYPEIDALSGVKKVKPLRSTSEADAERARRAGARGGALDLFRAPRGIQPDRRRVSERESVARMERSAMRDRPRISLRFIRATPPRIGLDPVHHLDEEFP